MVTILPELGHTFSEYSLMPGYTRRTCILKDISLETRLHDSLLLKIPFLSAAMMSVTGYEMALDLGKEGGLGVLPARLTVDEQVEIVRRIKGYEMGFVEDPVTVREGDTIEEVLMAIEKYGHSKIPVVDRNNVFKGMFLQSLYWESPVSIQEPVDAIMVPFREDGEIPHSNDPNINVDEVKGLLRGNNNNYIVVLDDQGRLVKLAFKKDVEKINVGVAVTTHRGWEERVERNLGAGVDLIVIDTSDAHNDFAADVVKAYKSMSSSVPICAGNVVTGEGAMFLMEAGADIIKVGMSTGSICTTQREKAVGRAPMSALLDVDKARKEFSHRGKYVPIIVDGGIASAADMVIALSVADVMMMGNYFNRFYEAAGEKLDESGKVTRIEIEMAEVATWGEASQRGRNLDRYGHASMKTFFAEGVEGTVPYNGHLKATLKTDILKIKGALVNAGCQNLAELRRDAVLELNSPYAKAVIGNVHDIKTR